LSLMLFDVFSAISSKTSTVCPQTIDTDHGSDDRAGMRWEEQLFQVFDDLEQQAEGLALVERDALVEEQSRAEYAAVDLAARVHGSLGTVVHVEVAGLGTLEGALRRAGEGWLLLDAGGRAWLVPMSAVRRLRGLADKPVDPAVRPLTARLGLGSALRGLAEARSETVLHTIDGQLMRVVIGRVGADFVEVRGEGAGAVELVPFAGIAAVAVD